MFTTKDNNQISERGSDLKTVAQQIENFKNGFPFLKLEKAATPEDGILTLNQDEIEELTSFYDDQSKQKQIVKFVPASGAASRMFKLLFGFLEICDDEQKKQIELDKSKDAQSIFTFFDRIKDFAFAEDLEIELQKHGKSMDSCLAYGDHASILSLLLEDGGLNYGSSPKGLLKFHSYPTEKRTPSMEHLAEGALYAQSANNVVNIHFTVSPEHRQRFAAHIAKNTAAFEAKYGVKFQVSFSEQKSYTDTIAVDLNNEPFRNEDGSLLFRPAGHGALIANLNDIDADVIFVKNIDNVVPDKLKTSTIEFKKTLAAILLKMQGLLFNYLNQLDEGVDSEKIAEMLHFLKNELHIKNVPSFKDDAEAIEFLKAKFNRPLRICGMVKNEGEPGGGPFFANNADGTQSLQIAESSQIDMENKHQKSIAQAASHFNPVDLVCGVRDYKGQKFDLTKFVDHSTGFISQKSKDGKDLKAQELPGLWNGAMSDWNTLFVEVPISTFNPVKTVNDLLRDQHQ